MLVFDRFLARVQAQFGDRVVIKGGVVLELRLKRARATKDIDLRLTGSPDLPDLALLATIGPLSSSELRRAIDATFEFRNTHGLPDAMPAPPSSWEAPYGRMAQSNKLPWGTLVEVTAAVVGFLDPVLLPAVGDAFWDSVP